MRLNKILPKELKAFIRRKRAKKIINVFDKEKNKKALLSYIQKPFKNSLKEHTSHYEAVTLARVLDELGYQVDVIEYNIDYVDLDLDRYDVVCGFGNVFQQCFQLLNFNAKTVFYATGMHATTQNTNTLNRLRLFHDKHGLWIHDSVRYVEPYWGHQSLLVDGIISLGNEESLKTYRESYNGIIETVPVPFFETVDAEQILKIRCKSSKNKYLWFGSKGFIHKGLDLLLDYFSQRDDLELHICGPEIESDFLNYYSELINSKNNIQFHGFVDITSEKFKALLEMCAFTILPSCSEGGGASVITAIGNGGLIPIVTKESTVKTGNEIKIKDLSTREVHKAIEISQALTWDEMVFKMKENLEYVRQSHSQENYENKIKQSVRKILK